MNEAGDKYFFQLNKNAKAGHCADCAVKNVTQLVLHIFALEPVHHISGGIISTALG